MKVMITGAGGYIGSHLLHSFLNKNYELFAIAGSSLRSEERLKFLDVRGVQIDARDRTGISAVMGIFLPDVVIHLAGLKSPRQSNQVPNLYFKNNVGSLENIYEASREVGVSLLINASSSSVYGDIDGNSISEEQVGKPISVYGESKKLGEDFLTRNYESRLQTVSLRLFNVIGSGHERLRDSASFHLVPATINRVINNKSPIIFGHGFPTPDGTAIRDYVHVLDVVDMFNLVIDEHLKVKNSPLKPRHNIFNVGRGVGTSVLELVTLIGDLTDKRIKPIYRSPRDGDPAVVISNIGLASEVLGFAPKKSLREMLQSCL